VEPKSHNQLLAVILVMAMQNLGAEPAGEALPSAKDWPLCPAPLPIPERPKVEADLAPGAIHISADEADLEEDSISILQGNAEITRDRSRSVPMPSPTTGQQKPPISRAILNIGMMLFISPVRLRTWSLEQILASLKMHVMYSKTIVPVARLAKSCMSTPL